MKELDRVKKYFIKIQKLEKNTEAKGIYIHKFYIKLVYIL